MQRRTFFKSMLLGSAALFTPKLTQLEVAAAAETTLPRLPRMCKRAFVTVVKGPVATVNHGLGRSEVFVVACTIDGKIRQPRVEPLSANEAKLTFAEPTFFNKRKVYKVVVGCITELSLPPRIPL